MTDEVVRLRGVGVRKEEDHHAWAARVDADTGLMDVRARLREGGAFSLDLLLQRQCRAVRVSRRPNDVRIP